MKKLLIFLLVLALVIATPVAVNILQNGLGGPSGRSMGEILGISASNARVQHIEALSKSEIMQLFYAAKTPSFQNMKGEYRAQLLDKGVLAKASSFFTHNLMGPGKWIGKAFTPASRTEGWGYNIFLTGSGNGEGVARLVKMDTYVGPSVYDDRDSFHLVYEKYNLGMLSSMRDEIREINPNLYLGYGYMSWSGGKRNPAPFVLIGPPTKWEGVDAID
ncbi:hypothetical protein SAMN02745216_00854 [Desulfatibacillum alkenivorans DSM 16219]|jgi:hypothetical protein|uniref:Uncharacterized protein n=1 Tax=Desulfatibacillum alkenivorans DSM 16219 TaxID=1121393 RepID=A0A1M6FLF6_9BACT|nr:hypothetical protein [Desulfatibacillum alkenivorans]SHI98504.1 hypothetical protein SAMN02745216_00854 [Desulfatibacillum alkenivorans DSM 16219]